MKLYKWVNKFHNTECYSTLTKQAVLDIMYNQSLRISDIDKNNEGYRKLSRLRNKLCVHRGNSCECASFDKCEEESE